MFPKLTRTALRRKVPSGCPDRKEHVKVALANGAAPSNCTHDGVTVDPRMKQWWSRPVPKHGKITPRWYGIDKGSNGRTKKRKATKKELRGSGKILTDFDYASTPLTWGDRLPSSLI